MNSLSSKKLYFNDISVMRIMAMLLVVFYHCLCPYSVWDGTDAYIGFHVGTWDIVTGVLAQIQLPIFFMISGFLFGTKRTMGGYDNISLFVKNKMTRVLFPYVIVGFFLCILQHRNISQMLDGISHLWFLLVIFECYIFGKLIERILWISQKKKKMLIAITIIFFLFLSYRFSFLQIFNFSSFMIYFPYYTLGMLTCQFDFGKLKSIRICMMGLIVLLLLLLSLEFYLSNIRLLTLALGITIVVLIYCYFRSANIGPLKGWMCSLDHCSMGIYIVHHILIQEINRFAFFHNVAFEHFYIYPILQFFIVTLVSWGFVAVCRINKYSIYILG